MNKPKLLILVISIQLIFILSLAIIINNKHNQVLGTSINILSKKDLIFPKNPTFKYFYENTPNSTESSNLAWFGLPNENYTISIDSSGFNQLSNYSIEKPQGTYRIITIGDSYTYGSAVNTQDNYPSQLEKKLNSDLKCKNISNFQVINFGVPGYDIPYTVERYRIRGQQYSPDLVLWFLIGDDFKRYNEQLLPREKALENQLKESGQYSKLISQKNYYYAWTKVKNEILNEAGGEDSMLKMQEKSMEDLNKLYNGKLIVFTLDYPFIDNSGISMLKDFTRKRKDTYFNLSPNLYLQPGQMINNVGHPSAKGYAEIVDNLYDYMVLNNIIPCEKP